MYQMLSISVLVFVESKVYIDMTVELKIKVSLLKMNLFIGGSFHVLMADAGRACKPWLGVRLLPVLRVL